jgi:uncharacterized protein (UPF0261 family)
MSKPKLGDISGMKNIAVLSTSDTKGPETQYVKKIIESLGHKVIYIDGATLEEPKFEAEYPCDEVAKRAGTNIQAVRAIKGAGSAAKIMGKGAIAIVKELYDAGELDGIFGLGGGMNSTYASGAMRELPVGVPKFLVATKVNDPGSPQYYVGAKDVTLMPSFADIAGLNKVTNQILTNAAYAISGMVNAPKVEASGKPIAVLGMIGLTTGLGLGVKDLLEDKGYEVIVFHTMGIGGRCLEPFIRDDPEVVGIMEGCLWEVGNHLFDGLSTAGPHRLIEGPKKGIPQVLTPGACSCIAFRGMDTVPEKYKDRNFYEHNPKATPMLLNPDETKLAAETIAERINQSTGPVEFLIPTKGFCNLTGVEGAVFYEQEKASGAEKVFIETLKSNLRDDIPVKEIAANINDKVFIDAVVETFLKLTK